MKNDTRIANDKHKAQDKRILRRIPAGAPDKPVAGKHSWFSRASFKRIYLNQHRPAFVGPAKLAHSHLAG